MIRIPLFASLISIRRIAVRAGKFRPQRVGCECQAPKTFFVQREIYKSKTSYSL